MNKKRRKWGTGALWQDGNQWRAKHSGTAEPQQGGNNGKTETLSGRNAIEDVGAQENQGNGENSPLLHPLRYEDMTEDELMLLGMSGGSFGPLLNRIIKDPK